MCVCMFVCLYLIDEGMSQKARDREKGEIDKKKILQRGPRHSKMLGICVP